MRYHAGTVLNRSYSHFAKQLLTRVRFVCERDCSSLSGAATLHTREILKFVSVAIPKNTMKPGLKAAARRDVFVRIGEIRDTRTEEQRLRGSDWSGVMYDGANTFDMRPRVTGDPEMSRMRGLRFPAEKVVQFERTRR